MKIVAGLGNPGSQYLLTRHNIGQRVVAKMVADFRLSWSSKADLKSSIAVLDHATEKFIFVTPHTFMNLSGESVQLVSSYYKIDTTRDLLVIADDVALPFGTLRLRASGSTGGHNGLGSIGNILGHSKYTRLRIGVGGHVNACDSINDFLGHKPLEDYVLEKFKDSEDQALPAFLARACQACQLWLEKPLSEAMSQINKPSNSIL